MTYLDNLDFSTELTGDSEKQPMVKVTFFTTGDLAPGFCVWLTVEKLGKLVEELSERRSLIDPEYAKFTTFAK